MRRERGTRNSRRSEQLRTGEREVPPELSALKDRIAAMVGGLTGAAADLQETSRGIHPAILSRGGLGPALKTLRRSRDFARRRWPFGQHKMTVCLVGANRRPDPLRQARRWLRPMVSRGDEASASATTVAAQSVPRDANAPFVHVDEAA